MGPGGCREGKLKFQVVRQCACFGVRQGQERVNPDGESGGWGGPLGERLARGRVGHEWGWVGVVSRVVPGVLTANVFVGGT